MRLKKEKTRKALKKQLCSLHILALEGKLGVKLYFILLSLSLAKNTLRAAYVGLNSQRKLIRCSVSPASSFGALKA